MRYIAENGRYGRLLYVSFGADIECDGQTCYELKDTAMLDGGYNSLEKWYCDNVNKLHLWAVDTTGDLVMIDDPDEPEEDAISQSVVFNNNVHIFAKDPNGVRTNVMEPNNADGNLIIGWGNYNGKKGDSAIYGHDTWVGVSNIAAPNRFRPYYRRGESHNVHLYLTGWVTTGAAAVYFIVPTSKPIIGSPTVTATSVSGFVLRQGGNYTHGCTAGDDYIMPDSYKCTLAGTSGVLICATFSNTANAVNNESIGILWDGKITFS